MELTISYIVFLLILIFLFIKSYNFNNRKEYFKLLKEKRKIMNDLEELKF